jgi:hypothetical protein
MTGKKIHTFLTVNTEWFSAQRNFEKAIKRGGMQHTSK